MNFTHCSDLLNDCDFFFLMSVLTESNLLTRLYRKEETIQVVGNGCISSPRFPASYPRNLLLTWILDSAENTRIQLTFDSQFGLEEQENDVCR